MDYSAENTPASERMVKQSHRGKDQHANKHHILMLNPQAPVEQNIN